MNKTIRTGGRWFAEPSYYKKVIFLVLPMILQAAVTNFVSLADNIMVGQIGTVQMSGVSIVNQYIFIFNLTVFGAVSGPGIFGTQFFGKRDAEGQQYTVRFRVISAVLIILAGMALFQIYKEPLIRLFLSADDAPELVEETLFYGVEYLNIVVFSIIPFAIGQVYASAVRECGRTQIPMMASFLAVGVNLVLDYLLIFGVFGMPKMGVAGAALATVIAKCIEAAVIIIWAHTHPKENPYIPGLYRSLRIPRDLFRRILIKSLPLLINEFLWSLGVAVIAQCYSSRGLEVVAARNIAGTINNMFNVVYIQMGGAIGILIGQLLGAGKHEEAKKRAAHLTVFSLILAGIVMLILIPLAFVFPSVYNTEASVRSLATGFILIQAAATPLWSYTNASYFILRSGGKTGITFLFDFGFTWFLQIPLAFCLSRFTAMPIFPLFAIVTWAEAVKIIIGWLMVRSGIWINTIVE
ncbi:MAG: MATE family efflux transporter [Lachnospiraceae bacterium]|nr:MATE family efflux transporter [Lachnospiraceae bacterium]